MTKKLTWEKLIPLLPLLKITQLEREAGLRPGRIRDVKHGKSSLTADELETIRLVLKKMNK